MSFRYRHGDRPLDGYTIQRGVGRGGFGEVYYAISDGGREVALKALLLNHDIELRGVRQCINLKNPHLVSIFDVRLTDDGLPFVIMEYVAGPSLRELIHQNAQGLGSQKAGYLIREIAKGLAYLHDRGIVHRDLKPENIFYEDGYVKIGDYGLSKYISVSRQSGQTMSVGTVHYMAPEIGTGIYNRGIDIYALGIILHELLTGKVPFSGDSFGEIIMKHLTAKPDLSAVDEPFRSVIARALEKKPEDRYPTAEAMVEELFSAEALQSSVSTFNPSALSAAARRVIPASAGAETLVVGNGNDGAPGGAYDPSAGAFAVGLATPPPRAGSSGDDPFREPPPLAAPAPERPAAAPPRLPMETDPLDEGQRRARAVFALALATLGTMIFLRQNFVQAVGFLLVTASSTGAILLADGPLAKRFQVEQGPWRRLIAAVVAAPPALIFGHAFHVFGWRHVEPGVMIHLLSLVLVNWGLRTDPRREARVAVSSALMACVPALILNLFYLMDWRTLMVQAGALATISFVLNALSPYIPRHLRKKVKREATPPAPGPVAAAAAAANRWPLPPRAQVPPARERKRWSWKSCGHGARKVFSRRGRVDRAPLQVDYKAGSAETPPPAYPRAAAAPLPRHRRPVPGYLRFVHYLCSAAGLITGIIVLAGAFYTGRFELYAQGVTGLTLGAFFMRQARREERGTIWGGTLRPFLLFASAGALMVCAAMYAHWGHLTPNERQALWRGASFAIATWILAYTLRSPHDRARSPLEDPTGSSVRAGEAARSGRYVHRGWAAFGTLLWMAALGMTVLACASTTGVIGILDPSGRLENEFFRALPAGLWSIAGNLVAAAGISMVISRRRAGTVHLVRGVLGQVAFACMILHIYFLSQGITVTPRWTLEFRTWNWEMDSVFAVLGTGVAGAVLMAWPMARKKPAPAAELADLSAAAPPAG